MTDTPKPIIHPTEFRDWLKTHATDDVVGYGSDDCDCPVARFLRGRDGAMVRVNGFEVRYLHADTRVALPRWAQDFIEEVDDVYPEVLACDALEILDKVFS